MKHSPLTRRTPLARGAVALARTPLAKVGKKARRDRAELAAVRAIVEQRSGGRCEMVHDGALRTARCTFPAVHLHHVQRRSQGGSNEASNLAHLCSTCHVMIHENPAWALEAGWLARAVS